MRGYEEDWNDYATLRSKVVDTEDQIGYCQEEVYITSIYRCGQLFIRYSVKEDNNLVVNFIL